MSESNSDSNQNLTELPNKSKTQIDDITMNAQYRYSMGILFNAKFFGFEDVKKETGDDVCQDSLVKLKAIVSAKKEHKQKIILKINLDGIEIVNKDNNEIMYKHSVNRISYIARDPKDSRAIGYIYKNPDNNYQYFGIKTEKQAQELFNELKGLFEVVLDIKKKLKNIDEKDQKEKIQEFKKPLDNQTEKVEDKLASSFNEQTKIHDKNLSHTDDHLTQIASPISQDNNDLLNLDFQPAVPSKQSNLFESNYQNNNLKNELTQNSLDFNGMLFNSEVNFTENFQTNILQSSSNPFQLENISMNNVLSNQNNFNDKNNEATKNIQKSNSDILNDLNFQW